MEESEMIPEDKLPHQLWVEIFSKLPVRVLLTSRCVSKTWRSFIDNPNFVHAHLSFYPNNADNHFVLSWETGPTDIWDVYEWVIRICTMGKFRHRQEIFKVRYSSKELYYDHKGYVNGVLLFTSHNNDHLSAKLIVFNPSITKQKVLPPFPPGPVGKAEIVIGYDPVQNDHKVVVIFIPFRLPEDEYPDSIAVYEFSTGCWRVKSPVEVPDIQKWYLGDKIFAKGVMHWLCFDLSLAIQQRRPPKNDTHLVSFDFTSETFSYSELPGDRGDDSSEKISVPFVLGDSFALFDICSARTCVWVLGKYDRSGANSWSKWYDEASDPELFGFFKEHKHRVKSFLYCEKIKRFLMGVNGEVISYDMENNTMKTLVTCYSCYPMGFQTCRCSYVMRPYVESLALLKIVKAPSSTSCSAVGEESRGVCFV